MTVIRNVYQKKDFLSDVESLKVWYEILKDLSYEQVQAAIIKHATKSPFPPSIAEIRGAVVSITDESDDWGGAWEQVRKAIGRYGYTREKEAMESFDSLTRMTVQRLGWRQVCETDLDDLMSVRANFRMIYESLHEKEDESARMPETLKKMIDGITSEKKQLGEKGETNEQRLPNWESDA